MSLVSVTKEGRLFLKVGGVLFGIGFLLFMIIKGGTLVRNVFFPKPPPPPMEGLGKLPHITFPSTGQTGIQFTVNTVNGQLPRLPDRVNVYKLTQPEPNLLALETAKNTLDGENFTESQIKLSDTLYQWTQARTGATIKYDIVTKNFTIASNYLTNPALIGTTQIPSEDNISSDMIGFLDTINANTSDLDVSKNKVELLEMQNGALVAAQNLGSARLARITLHQKDIDTIPIVYDNPNDSILTFVVSYPGGSFKVLEGEFYNHVPDSTIKSDYPIKSAVSALEDLKNGNAYIINPQNLTNVDITNVELKYYLNRQSKDFLLPVIVFTGINFTAYVEAVPDLQN